MLHFSFDAISRRAVRSVVLGLDESHVRHVKAEKSWYDAQITAWGEHLLLHVLKPLHLLSERAGRYKARSAQERSKTRLG
jgi:hypothetical protein